MQHKINNTKNKGYLTASTLPVVMVISVLILLIVLFVYSLWSMNFIYYSSYHYKKQQQENLNSTIVLYNNDSTFMAEYDEEKTIQLFEYDSTSTVAVVSKQWGLYEYLQLTSHNGNFTSTRLLGKKQECDYKASLWLCDRNRALTLAGETDISGKVFAPISGIYYTDIDGEDYKGKKIPSNNTDIAGAQLPLIDSTSLVHPKMLKSHQDQSEILPKNTDTYYSFNDPISYFNYSDNTDNIMLRGNAVLFADELKITNSSKINDVIIIARKVIIEEGFTGSMQIFCSDSVLIEENVTLQYPSGIYLDTEIDYPYVYLSDNSEINGYIIILGKIKDEELLFPSYKQLERSIFRGLLYVDGTTNIKGELSGAVYLKDCFFTYNQNVYAGTLNNTQISRNENIAYPIFLLGNYTRKEIKSIY